MVTPALPIPQDRCSPTPNLHVFLGLIVLIICAAIVPPLLTRLDGFPLDEDYHIVAGVSYIQRADFRINPEHPPLVKPWVGVIISGMGFRVSPFREVHDKSGERAFAAENVWSSKNDPF